MSRKKTVKPSAKRKVSKRSAPKNTASPVQKLEKSFSDIQAQIIAFLKNASTKLIKVENKQKATSHKLASKVKASEQRIKSLSKGTLNAAKKKQLSKLKKDLAASLKAQAAFNSQLQATSRSLADINNQLAKYIALGKNLTQFEKDWAKKSKESKVKAVSVTKAKSKRSAPKKAKRKSSQPSTTPQDNAGIFSLQTSNDPFADTTEETTEKTAEAIA